MDINYHSTKSSPYGITSGGVVFDDSQKVLLLFKLEGGSRSYHLPKGTLEKNESLEACAKREIMEESGAEVEIVCYLGGLQFEFMFSGYNLNKINNYYGAKLKSAELRDMDGEHQGREWVSMDEACELLKLNNNPKEEWVIIQRLQRWLVAEENE